MPVRFGYFKLRFQNNIEGDLHAGQIFHINAFDVDIRQLRTVDRTHQSGGDIEALAVLFQPIGHRAVQLIIETVRNVLFKRTILRHARSLRILL